MTAEGDFPFSLTFSDFIVFTLEPEAALVDVPAAALCGRFGVVFEGVTALDEVEDPLIGLTLPFTVLYDSISDPVGFDIEVGAFTCLTFL